MENSPQPPSRVDPPATCCPDDRRGFFAQATALALGTVAFLVPTVVGMVAFLNPLRQKSRAGEFMRLTSLDALPEDGTPRKFPVIADRTDAWNRFPDEPIGAVYLRRTGRREDPVLALQVICPHAGCSVNYAESEEGGKLFCPCHAASFDFDGKRLDKKSPSPRDMDTLEVKIEDNQVLVRFQNFKAGTSKKVAKA